MNSYIRIGYYMYYIRIGYYYWGVNNNIINFNSIVTLFNGNVKVIEYI